MGTDNWMVVGKIKPPSVDKLDQRFPRVVSEDLSKVFGHPVWAEDVELQECDDVSRNYFLYSWLGEGYGKIQSRYGDLDAREEEIEAALYDLDIVDDYGDSYSYPGTQRNPLAPRGHYVGGRQKNIIPLSDITDFDYDQICPDISAEGRTYREIFKEEGADLLEQAKRLQAEGWQFFIYGFSG